jgi:hypothetical protein
MFDIQKQNFQRPIYPCIGRRLTSKRNYKIYTLQVVDYQYVIYTLCFILLKMLRKCKKMI